jgi:hypothetical protein
VPLPAEVHLELLPIATPLTHSLSQHILIRMKKHKLSYLGVTFAIALALTGCATSQPFHDGAPVERSGFFIARTYTQEGKPLSTSDLYDQLEKNEDAGESASAGHLWYYSALVTGGIGGYFIVYNLTNRADSGEKQTGVGIGAGFLALSLISAYMADYGLRRAVDIYNQKLTPAAAAKETGLRWTPTFSLANGPGNGLETITPIFGFAMSY